MLAKDLMDRIERLGLLDQEIVEALRQQLDQGGSRVTPEAVAKLLVDNGQLTSFQATKLIGELRSGDYDDGGPAEADLIAGIEDEVIEVDSIDPTVEVEAVPLDQFGGGPVAVEAVPVEAQPAQVVAEAVATNRPARTRPKPPPQKSVWDSFKVYGYLGIIVSLLLIGGVLYTLLSRESADAVIENANAAYDQQSYEVAQTKYLGFLDTFGEDHQFSSLARTRVGMTQLYKAATFKQEPDQAVSKAQELLPSIAEEEGMNQERANLAALLVDIAANIANVAGKATETSKKEMLLGTLDEHKELMDNPLYMPSSLRVTLAEQIKSVEEARERVQRDIDRNKRLDQAESEMQAALADQDTKLAYDIRKSLLRDFPELFDNERLVTLIRKASEIQQTLVSKADRLPESEIGNDTGTKSRSIVLTSLAGEEAPDLDEETLYLRAGGSVMAFEGSTGKLKWRNFVGYADDLPPLGVEDGLGVLLSDSSTDAIRRCDAESGDVAWTTTLGEPFSQPTTYKDDVFVSLDSGRLLSMDIESGDVNWGTQFPQPLETGPGIEESLRLLYQPGNHSNLYVLGARDGKCLESYYIGHNEGTIAVAPVPLFGHLFVIENAGTDFSIVHILKYDEKGRQLEVAQDPIRLVGNVRVDPIIQKQRLIVLTDLGHVTVLEVELAAEGNKVSVGAELPPFYDKPTSTQMTVGGTAMWITGTRLGRYKLQVSTGQVIRDWSLHELDRFVGRPYIGDDTLVYSRILRGTSAIRVTAADAKTGEEIWRTDVGVPVAKIESKQEGGFHVVTSQAALFTLDSQSLASGSTKNPSENPGAESVNIRYEKAVEMSAGRYAFLDQGGGEGVLIYDPSRDREKLRQVTMPLSGGRPSGGMVFAGNGLFLPLSTGRAVWVDWRTGALGETPFQPNSDPTGSVRWSQPVVDQNDGELVVVADSRKQIYLLRVGRRISKVRSLQIENAFLGPATRVGDTYFATTAGSAADFLVSHSMKTLDEETKLLLPGRVVWGPTSAGDLCLIQTDDGNVRAFTENGSEAFSVSVPAGPPVGQPVVIDGQFVIAGAAGWLATIDSASGTLVGTTDLGQPISSTPKRVGKNLLVPGREGVVFVSPVP